MFAGRASNLEGSNPNRWWRIDRGWKVMWTWRHAAIIVGFLLGLLLVLKLLQQRQRPSVTLSWLLAMLLLPYVVVPLFVLFSGRKLRSRLARKSSPLGDPAAAHEGQGQGVHRLLSGEGCAPLREGNAVELLLGGEMAFERLMATLEGARRSIHLSIFILARDDVGRQVVETLARKAREGVEVRLLVDALGCLRTRGHFLDPIRQSGGSVGVFLPVTPLHRRWSANLRNHRKLAIIDGEIAWTGGMNLALEYLGPMPDPMRWIDGSALLQGPAVTDLEEVFRGDWEFATSERIDLQGHRGPTLGAERVQVLASGPDVSVDRLSDAILALASRAQHRIALVTPYFVPDDALMRALTVQARMGCKVLLVLPERSNHRLADLARIRFLQELARAGADVRLLPDRMVHAKALVFDDHTAIFGSANVDLRSLYLNFEVSLVLREGPSFNALADWIEGLARAGHPLAKAEPRLLTRLLADASHLLAPLL